MLIAGTKAQRKHAPAGPRGRLFSGVAEDVRDRESELYARCERESDAGIVRTRVWHVPLFVVTDPAMIEEVLVKKTQCFIKPLGVRAMKHAFGQGLLTSEQEQWRTQRKIIQPSFHGRKMTDYGAIMADSAQAMLARWRDGESRNVHQDMIDVCLDVIARAMFGDAMEEGRGQISEAAAVVQAFSVAHRDFFRPNPFYLPVKVNFRYRRAVRELDRFVYRYIEQRRQAGDTQRGDLLSLLLTARDESGQPMPDRQIRDEIVTMFLAGHETAASALSWSLYLVARHPEVARKLHEEADRVLGDRAPTFADTDALEYTERVIKESFRLFPPVYRVGRTAIEDCEIGGYHIPKGSEVILPQWAVHRSARHYDRPLEFVPERWTSELAERLPKYAFFPFSGGPRQCIGSGFVLKEDILILAAIAQQFRLELEPGFEAKPHEAFTLVPEGARIPMRLSRRKSVSTGLTTRVEAAGSSPAVSRCPFHALFGAKRG